MNFDTDGLYDKSKLISKIDNIDDKVLSLAETLIVMDLGV